MELKFHKTRSQRRKPQGQENTSGSFALPVQDWESQIELLAMQLCPTEEWARYEHDIQALVRSDQRNPVGSTIPFATRPARQASKFRGKAAPTPSSAKPWASPGAPAGLNHTGPGQTGRTSSGQGPYRAVPEAAKIRLFPVWRKYRQQAKRVATLYHISPFFKRLPLTWVGWLGDLLFK